jgi:diketogulonate reductase-like aldo/keto reductase
MSPAARSTGSIKTGVENMDLTRRRLVQASLAAAIGTAWPKGADAQTGSIATRPIPSSGEKLPVVGLGSSITFNVGDDSVLQDECAAVIAAFFAAGGRLIDSSPMYGSAQATIGYGLSKFGIPPALFAADKVWIADAESGPSQVERSRASWKVPRFDLLQVHNLLSWEEHLPMLLKMKAEGNLRYVGVTTSHGRRHEDIERIMASQPIDFVQVTYNVVDREVEQRILPLAQERRIAVIVNRPFRRGELTRSLRGQPLPDWAADAGAASWAQLLLKFIISHPAVTCAIPATSRVEHVRENLAAAGGALADESMRRKIAEHVGAL